MNKQVSLPAALFNLATMLLFNPRKEEENAITAAEAVYNNEALRLQVIPELQDKGYLTSEEDPTVTQFGVRLAMVSKSPTPDLNRLCNNNPGACFACLITGSENLKKIMETNGQKQITQGKTDLYKNLKEVQNFLNTILEESIVEEEVSLFKKEPRKTKSVKTA